jgi:hypothetical protein
MLNQAIPQDVDEAAEIGTIPSHDPAEAVPVGKLNLVNAPRHL